MLHIFCNGLHTCFLVFSIASVSTVLDVCCKCSSYFRRMLQVFRLNVAKVYRVLHMLQWDPPAPAGCYSYWGSVHAHGKRRGHSAESGEGWRQGHGQSWPVRAARYGCGQSPHVHVVGYRHRHGWSPCASRHVAIVFY
jgi:hypothetical protein